MKVSKVLVIVLVTVLGASGNLLEVTEPGGGQTGKDERLRLLLRRIPDDFSHFLQELSDFGGARRKIRL